MPEPLNLPIQSEYRKIRTKKTPHLDTFHAVIVSQIKQKWRSDYEKKKKKTSMVSN